MQSELPEQRANSELLLVLVEMRAWTNGLPCVAPIKHEKDFTVYRVWDRQTPNRGMIAKYGWERSLAIESHVYQRVLPRLLADGVACLGYREAEDGRHAWLFLEEVQGEPYLSPRLEHRQHAGAWLAHLHAMSTGALKVESLPDRGSRSYLNHLHATRRRLEERIAKAALTGHVGAVQEVLDLLTLVEEHWDLVRCIEASLPTVLVHGDFAPKNIRFRTSRSAQEIVVFDWEYAGWGMPAVDLAPGTLGAVHPDPHAYWSVIRDAWNWLTFDEVARLAGVGSVFRVLAALDWATEDLEDSDLTELLSHMKVYRDAAVAALQSVGWMHSVPSAGAV